MILPTGKCSFVRRTTQDWAKHSPYQGHSPGALNPPNTASGHAMACLPVPKTSMALLWLHRARSCRSSSPQGLSRSGGSCSVAPRQGSLGLSPRQTGLKM